MLHMVMATLLCLAGNASEAALEDAKKDVILELVLQFAGSYVGMALGVSFLVELLKMLAKDWIKTRAPQLTIIFTFIFGATVKWLLPDVYGTNTYKSWVLHFLVLVFVAVLAAVFHDKFWNAIKGKLGIIIPGFEAEEEKPPPSTGSGAGGEAGKK